MNKYSELDEIKEELKEALKHDENSLVQSTNQHVDSKRTFLGTLMTISVAIIAGLFVLITNGNYDSCFRGLAIGSGGLFVVSVMGASIYLIVILWGESLSLDRRRQFLINSRGCLMGVTDDESFRGYGELTLREAEKSKQKVKGSQEIWFVIVSFLLILAFLSLLFVIGNVLGLVKLCNIQ